jgi:hypothetical protein
MRVEAEAEEMLDLLGGRPPDDPQPRGFVAPVTDGQPP